MHKINFEMWSDPYRKIIAEAEGLDEKSVALLEDLSKQIFDYAYDFEYEHENISYSSTSGLTIGDARADSKIPADWTYIMAALTKLFNSYYVTLLTEEYLLPTLLSCIEEMRQGGSVAGFNSLVRDIMGKDVADINRAIKKDASPDDINKLVSKAAKNYRSENRDYFELKYLVKNGMLQSAKDKLENGAVIYDGIIEDAIKSCNLRLVDYLNEKHFVPLPEIIPAGLKDGFGYYMFSELLRRGMSMDNYGLNDKIVLRDPSAVSKCITRGDSLTRKFSSDVVSKTKERRRSRYAAMRAHSKPLANLIEKRIPLECSILHYAAMHAHPKSLAMLIEKGLDVDCKDSNGRTPLHYAIKAAMTKNVKLLSMAGNVDATDFKKMAPLHLATDSSTPLKPFVGMHKKEDLELIRSDMALLLVQAGASLDAKDIKGNKTRDYIEKFNPCILHKTCKATKKVNEKENPYNDNEGSKSMVKSLVHLSAIVVSKDKNLTKDLAYRETLPGELIDKFEEIALEDKLMISKNCREKARSKGISIGSRR